MVSAVNVREFRRLVRVIGPSHITDDIEQNVDIFVPEKSYYR